MTRVGWRPFEVPVGHLNPSKKSNHHSSLSFNPTIKQVDLLTLHHPVVQVLIYGLPTCTTSEVSLVADLTQSLANCVRKSEDWTRLISSRTVLRLRGGGRNGREPLVDKSSSESKQLIREYQVRLHLTLFSHFLSFLRIWTLPWSLH